MVLCMDVDMMCMGINRCYLYCTIRVGRTIQHSDFSKLLECERNLVIKKYYFINLTFYDEHSILRMFGYNCHSVNAFRKGNTTHCTIYIRTMSICTGVCVNAYVFI